jgi:hypothetical protein
MYICFVCHKKKQKKMAFPSAWAVALRDDFLKFKTSSCLPQVPGPDTRVERLFFKKKNFFPECWTRGRGFFFKKKSSPHSGKRFFCKKEKKFDGADGIKSSPRVSVALREGFPECTRFGTRGRPLPREKRPR